MRPLHLLSLIYLNNIGIKKLDKISSSQYSLKDKTFNCIETSSNKKELIKYESP